MGTWIWKFGEFEIYHSLMVHNRRQQYGWAEPPVWKLYAPEPAVRFRKKVTTEGGVFRVYACGNTAVDITAENGESKAFGGRPEIRLEPGTWVVDIRVSNPHTFPCLYVEGVIESDETWEADDLSYLFEPVGCCSLFNSPQKTPEVFPFSYEPISYVKKEAAGSGVLFDFGRETFAKVRITGLPEEPVQVSYGESREEAMDREFSVIHFNDVPEDGVLSYEPYAFRYLYVGCAFAEANAWYEYLPLEYKGAFHCDEDVINRVWDTAAYTFHLNCREFILDGIKRDRWVWAADVYQSLFVNHYLFQDAELEKRTLTALGGKRPITMHINRIMDYSFFWMISLYEYYRAYGDRKFLKQIYPQLKEVMDFCRSRADADGFVREKPGDWIFIDWADMDKTGALCGEQILFAQAMDCYAAVCKVIDKSDDGCGELAVGLRREIFAKFYDPDKRVFIDSFESGRRNVTRHSNILAYLFLPCSAEQKKDLYERVILNDEVPQITTPYFKFYENQVHCEAGNSRLLEESIRQYYGSMLKTGATTLYEEYDPLKSGAEHYAMYGRPFEKSLCHAWSASPVYLLGCFRLGVKNTGIAYDTFEVCPQPGELREFSGRVPVPGGSVAVSVNRREVRVLSTVPGGTLILPGCRIKLKPGQETVVSRDRINA
jgi:alpha-L-rhamnosidase